MRAFLGGEQVTVQRWATWAAGVAQGARSEAQARLLFAPAADAVDPGGRRGLVIPKFDVFGDYASDVQAHDLIVRADTSVLEVVSAPQRWTSPYTQRNTGMQTSAVQLVDDGPETVDLFLSSESNDGYGTVTRRPSVGATRVAGVSVEPLPARESSQSGQDAPAEYRLAGRSLDNLDAFAAVEWPVGSGQRFEVVGTPLRWPWPPWASYTVATMRGV